MVSFLHVFSMIFSTLRSRTGVLLISTTLIVLLIIGLFFYIRKEFMLTRTEVTEDVMVEKIVSMGKLELVKYSMKDVIEKKEIRRIFPDKRILFVAVGEVTGCVDLTRVKASDISASGDDSVTVVLPQPEICYVKLDHQQSRVYDVSGVIFPEDTKAMVENIYQIAEQSILENARKQNILGKTRENATLIFKPILENISGKKVGLQFGN